MDAPTLDLKRRLARLLVEKSYREGDFLLGYIVSERVNV